MSRPLPSSFDNDTEFYEENRWEKFSRRLKEEPLIPFGCALTCFALLGASRSIRAGDHNKTNRMFRARILAQGFTLVAMVAGSMYWQTDRQKRKEFDAVVAEKKAKEKNEAWIKELEARDEEEKEIRAMRQRRAGARGEDVIRGLKLKEGGEHGETRSEGNDEVKFSESVVEESEKKGGVLESVQNLVWGKK